MRAGDDNQPVQMDRIELDPEAAERLAALLADRDDEICLRVGVVGGGCAGFQYRLGLDRRGDEDLAFESHGQTVIVDPVSFRLVVGSTIVYIDDVMQQGFSVENPNAEAACGCGSSFTVRDCEGC